VLRKVDAKGNVTTVVGGNLTGPFDGDGIGLIKIQP
jgi:hypothetical protein